MRAEAAPARPGARLQQQGPRSGPPGAGHVTPPAQLREPWVLGRQQSPCALADGRHSLRHKRETSISRHQMQTCQSFSFRGSAPSTGAPPSPPPSPPCQDPPPPKAERRAELSANGLLSGQARPRPSAPLTKRQGGVRRASWEAARPRGMAGAEVRPAPTPHRSHASSQCHGLKQHLGGIKLPHTAG